MLCISNNRLHGGRHCITRGPQRLEQNRGGNKNRREKNGKGEKNQGRGESKGKRNNQGGGESKVNRGKQPPRGESGHGRKSLTVCTHKLDLCVWKTNEFVYNNIEKSCQIMNTTLIITVTVVFLESWY